MALAEIRGEGAGRTSGWYGLFGLSSDPFGDESGDYYYGSRYGVESLRLEQALERKRGVIVITGPSGTGKTALLRSVLSRVETTATATISAADRAPASVIEALLGEHDSGGSEAGSSQRRATLLAVLHRARASGRPVVCVVEDAHLAKASQLRELLGAIEVTAEAQGVVQLVLVGEPALNQTLQSSALKPLKARIIARVETVRLSAGEVAEFVMDRLELAGSTAAARIFPPAAISAIHRISGGQIGRVGPLARASLIRASEAASFSVSAEHVVHAAARCESLRPPISPSLFAADGPLRHWATSGSALGLVLLALIVAAAQVSMISGPRAPVEASLGAIPAPATPADLDRLAGDARAQHAGTDTMDDAEAIAALAQLRTPREEFLEGTPYEVEIAPPPRPSAEPSQTHPPSGEPIVEMPLPPSGTRQGIYPMPAPTTPAGDGSSVPAGEPYRAPGPGAVQAAPIASPGPAGVAVSLQVGAFREMRSATSLKKKLSKSFADVYISTIDSGGEPLHRVRVGQFRTPEESAPLKQRLQAMGYPSFRVTEP